MQGKILNLKIKHRRFFFWWRKNLCVLCFSKCSAIFIRNYRRLCWAFVNSYKYRRFNDKMIRDHIVISCVSIHLWRRTTNAGKRPFFQITSRYRVKNRAWDKQATKMEKWKTLTQLMTGNWWRALCIQM